MPVRRGGGGAAPVEEEPHGLAFAGAELVGEGGCVGGRVRGVGQQRQDEVARGIPGRVAVGVLVLVEQVERGDHVVGAARCALGGVAAGITQCLPSGGVQQSEGDEAGAATAGEAGGLRPERGHDELDRVGGVHVRPGVQEPDVAHPVTFAVLGRTSGAQVLQCGSEVLQLSRRGRPHAQGAPGSVSGADSADDPARCQGVEAASPLAAAGAERSAGEVTPMPSLMRLVAFAHRLKATKASPWTSGVSLTQKLCKPNSSARTARSSTPGCAAMTAPARIRTSTVCCGSIRTCSA